MTTTEPSKFSTLMTFDPLNPDPWLNELKRRTSTLPEVARRAVVHVLRAVLNDAYVRSDGCAPANAVPNEWVPWHVLRGRVEASELQSPGVLLVHEVRRSRRGRMVLRHARLMELLLQSKGTPTKIWSLINRAAAGHFRQTASNVMFGD